MFKLVLVFCSIIAVASIKKPEVFTEKIKAKDVQKKLVFPGSVRSQKQSLILAENSGIVTRLKKQLGYSNKEINKEPKFKDVEPMFKKRQPAKSKTSS